MAWNEGEPTGEEFKDNDFPDLPPTPYMQEALPKAMLPSMGAAQEMIDGIQLACLKDDITNPDLLRSIHEPDWDLPNLDLRTKLSFKMYNVLAGGSQQMYNGVRDAFAHHEPPTVLDSYYIVETKLKSITGIHKIMTDMCLNTCLAYTGPFSKLESCPICQTPRYNKVPSGSKRRGLQRSSSIPSRSACNSKHCGSLLKVHINCNIVIAKPRISCDTLRILGKVLSKNMKICLMARSISMPSKRASWVTMIPLQCSRLMAHSFIETKSQTAGLGYGS